MFMDLCLPMSGTLEDTPWSLLTRPNNIAAAGVYSTLLPFVEFLCYQLKSESYCW